MRDGTDALVVMLKFHPICKGTQWHPETDFSEYWMGVSRELTIVDHSSPVLPFIMPALQVDLAPKK